MASRSTKEMYDCEEGAENQYQLNEVEEVKKEVKIVKENLSKVNKDVDEVKAMMIQVLARLDTLELIKKVPSPTESMINTQREDILIAGGAVMVHSSRTTEIYSWEKNGWFEMSEMKTFHTGASSFIYYSQLFVAGGLRSNIIEILDLDKSPLKWEIFPSDLPNEFDDQRTVVYHQRIFHIAGYNYRKGPSNVIGELQFSSPCIIKELCQLPEPRERHGAEIFEDKVLIMGGETSGSYNATASVIEYDVLKNECKEMPPLPRALTKMATAQWRDQVVVLGGEGKDGEVLNDVFMYDCKTGKIDTLPSMLKKRSRCCAVITGNTIVAMGGWNKEDEALSSVEYFTMGGSTWEYLPAMNNSRKLAVAHVLPSTRKYV